MKNLTRDRSSDQKQYKKIQPVLGKNFFLLSEDMNIKGVFLKGFY